RVCRIPRYRGYNPDAFWPVLPGYAPEGAFFPLRGSSLRAYDTQTDYPRGHSGIPLLWHAGTSHFLLHIPCQKSPHPKVPPGGWHSGSYPYKSRLPWAWRDIVASCAETHRQSATV